MVGPRPAPATHAVPVRHGVHLDVGRRIAAQQVCELPLLQFGKGADDDVDAERLDDLAEVGVVADDGSGDRLLDERTAVRLGAEESHERRALTACGDAAGQLAGSGARTDDEDPGAATLGVTGRAAAT